MIACTCTSTIHEIMPSKYMYMYMVRAYTCKFRTLKCLEMKSVHFEPPPPPIILLDKPLHLNEGRFMQNGRCGYVLMPECMFDPGFNPMDVSTHTNSRPVTLSIQVRVIFIVLHIQYMQYNMYMYYTVHV